MNTSSSRAGTPRNGSSLRRRVGRVRVEVAEIGLQHPRVHQHVVGVADRDNLTEVQRHESIRELAYEAHVVFSQHQAGFELVADSQQQGGQTRRVMARDSRRGLIKQ